MIYKLLIAIVITVWLSGCDGRHTSHPLIDPEDIILLTVDGEPISIPMLEFMMTVRGVGEDDIEGMRGLLDELIRLRAVTNAAAREGIAESPAFRAERLVRDLERVQLAYFTHIYEQHPVTERQIEAVYASQLERAGTRQFQLQWVTYGQQLEALRDLARLEMGELNFAELAASAPARSQWVDRSQLPASIAAQVDEFEIGMVLPEPLPSPTGWQLAQVQDIRPLQAPALSEVRDGIERMLVRQRLEALVEDLYQAADIVPQLPMDETLGAGGAAQGN